jgi:hypothetical protein
VRGGNPEISELRGERARINQNVGRFDVLVDDVVRVESAESFRDLSGDAESRGERHGSPFEIVRKRYTS